MTETPRHIVAIASGKGGVGKSTVAMNLAMALRNLGLSVGLLDADIYGPSQGVMLGVPDDQKPDQKDGKYLLPIEAGGIKSMSMGYLASDRTPMVWRGPMASGAMAQMLEQTLWGGLDVLLVDMPPGTGDIQLTLSQKAALAGAVVVTTPQEIALLDARKGIEMFAKVNVPVLGVIENMAMHVCSACGHTEAVFGAEGGRRLAESYGVALLATLPLSLALREATDAGQSIVDADPESPAAVALAEAARAVWSQLESATASSGPVITMGED